MIFGIRKLESLSYRMVKKLPKISTAWVGCTNVTDRQTDGRPIVYSEREREFTSAKNPYFNDFAALYFIQAQYTLLQFLFVCLSVRHMRVSYQNGCRYHQTFSPLVVILHRCVPKIVEFGQILKRHQKRTLSVDEMRKLAILYKYVAMSRKLYNGFVNDSCFHIMERTGHNQRRRVFSPIRQMAVLYR